MVTLQVLPCGDGPPDVPRLLLGLTGERFHGYPLAEVRDAYRDLIAVEHKPGRSADKGAAGPRGR